MVECLTFLPYIIYLKLCFQQNSKKKVYQNKLLTKICICILFLFDIQSSAYSQNCNCNYYKNNDGAYCYTEYKYCDVYLILYCHTDKTYPDLWC